MEPVSILSLWFAGISAFGSIASGGIAAINTYLAHRKILSLKGPLQYIERMDKAKRREKNVMEVYEFIENCRPIASDIAKRYAKLQFVYAFLASVAAFAFVIALLYCIAVIYGKPISHDIFYREGTLSYTGYGTTFMLLIIGVVICYTILKISGYEFNPIKVKSLTRDVLGVIDRARNILKDYYKEVSSHSVIGIAVFGREHRGLRKALGLSDLEIEFLKSYNELYRVIFSSEVATFILRFKRNLDIIVNHYDSFLCESIGRSIISINRQSNIDDDELKKQLSEIFHYHGIRDKWENNQQELLNLVKSPQYSNLPQQIGAIIFPKK